MSISVVDGLFAARGVWFVGDIKQINLGLRKKNFHNIIKYSLKYVWNKLPNIILDIKLASAKTYVTKNLVRLFIFIDVTNANNISAFLYLSQ